MKNPLAPAKQNLEQKLRRAENEFKDGIFEKMAFQRKLQQGWTSSEVSEK